MDCYFIDLFLLYHDDLASWCDTNLSARPQNHQRQPCDEYTSITTKFDAIDPFLMIVDCCVAMGLAKLAIYFEILAMACTAGRPRVYPKFEVLWLIVMWIWTCSLRGLKHLFLYTSFAGFDTTHCCLLLCLLLGYHLRWRYAAFHQPKKVKIMACWSKTNAIPIIRR